jgi:xanthine dehydrogenase molybdenum-binding subunit
MQSPGVGHSVPRLESFAKLTGSGRYTVDVHLPGMLHAYLVRSPHPHARIIEVNDRQAREMPGVVCVLSSRNVPDLLPGLRAFDPVEGASSHPAAAHLFDSIVHWVGQPVALITAESAEQAQAAAETLEVRYEPLPAVLDPTTASPAQHVERRHGDVDTALGAADLVLERTFSTQRQKHAQLEPTAAIAHVSEEGKLSVWSAHQSPHRARASLATIFNLPSANVRVVTPLIGGAFGKSDALTAEPFVAAAALLCKRPVRLEYSRFEDFVGTDARHSTVTHLTIGFRRDGTIAALRARSVINAGATLGHSAVIPLIMVRQLLAPYRIKHFDVVADLVFTNTPGAGAFRGYGGPQACFPLEHLVDLGARHLGVDPLEARLRMRVRTGDDWRGLGPLLHDGLGECLERGAEATNWRSRQQRISAGGTFRRGIGLACTIWGSGTVAKSGPVDESGAEVRLEPDGSVLLSVGGCDLGTGLRTTLAQLCADELDVPLARITVEEADTDLTPFDSGAHASRSLYRNGEAVLLAAGELRKQILERAAQQLEVASADLELRDAVIQAHGVPSRVIALADLARDQAPLRASGQAQPNNAPTFISQFAEVVVDTETGRVGIERLVTVQEVGCAINPAVVIGQIQGAAHQGIGYALTEALLVDTDSGAIMNASFADYAVLTASETRGSEVILLEEPDPTGPHGARGVGELGVIPTAGAVANAILDATGVSVCDLPLTSERVLTALYASAQ